MQDSICLEKTIYGFQMFFVVFIYCAGNDPCMSIAIVTFQPFQTKWAVSAVCGMPLHYQFTVHKMPFILFSCLPPHAMYYVYFKAYFRNAIYNHLL